jgi:hypothetical protein
MEVIVRLVRSRRAAAGLAGALLLMACGGDGESSAPTTTGPPTTTTTVDQVALDRERANRIVLAAADVPGYTVDPPDTDDSGPDIDEAASACFDNHPLLVRLGEDEDRRGAKSPDFSKGEDQRVGSSATFGETEDEARGAIAALSAPSYAGCFSEASAAGLRANPIFANVAVTTTPLPAVNVGDQDIGYRSLIRTRVGNQNVTFFADFTFTRRGRAVVVLDDFSVGTPFPEAERVRLATALAGRMGA